MWARELRDANGKRGGLKESLRWIEDYERLAELAPRRAGRAREIVALLGRRANPDTMGQEQRIRRGR